MATHRDDHATDDVDDPNDPRLGPVIPDAITKARFAELHERQRNGTLPPPLSTAEAKRLLGLTSSTDDD